MTPIVGLVCQEDNRLALVHELSRYGVKVAPKHFQSTAIDGLLLDGTALTDAIPEDDLIDRLTSSDPDLFKAVIISHEGSGTEPAGLTLTPNVSAFAQQLRLFIRQRDVEKEARLRTATLQKLNANPFESDFESPAPQSVLFFGEPGPFYLKLKSNLTDQGIGVSAVLSERTAFEAFKAGIPDAFIVTIGENFYPYELLDHIHGRSDLRNMPVIAVSAMKDRLPELNESISALVRLGGNSENAITSIQGLMKRFRQQEPVRAGMCSAPARDRYTGTFSDVFAEAHLKAQISHSRLTGTQFCAVRLTPVDLSEHSDISANDLASFSSLLENVVRKQDLVARLDWNRFMVSLPSTSKADAIEAMERARRILEMTSMSGNKHFSFNYDVFELEPYHSPDHVWRYMSSPVKSTKTPAQASVA